MKTPTRAKLFWHSIFTLASSALFALILATPSLGAGLLKPTHGGGSQITIGAHHVNVLINNGFAQTQVDQIFTNNAALPLEAIYTFPLPKQASLSEVSMWVAGQEIIGEVIEKERARQIYEAQKSAGNQTALAEKNDFKTFDVQVGNIPANSEVRIKLTYYQPLEIDLNVGRYLYPLAEGNTDDQRMEFWSVDNQTTGPFSFNLKLNSAFPIKDVRMPGLENETTVQQAGGTGESGNGSTYNVSINRPAGSRLTRDIIFYYRLDDSVPARVELIPYRPDNRHDGTFMLIVTPAADLKPITEGTDWTFVLDVSGSMGGHKITTLAEGVSRVLGQLNPDDRFRIVTFSNETQDLTQGYVSATQAHVKDWIERIKSVQSGGGTNLYAGLSAGYQDLDSDRTTSIILVTDGVANLGETEHQAFLKLLEQYDIRLFTFVIGNSGNQPLLDRLAKSSGGFAMNISDNDDIAGRLAQAKAKVLHECLHDVKVSFTGEHVKELTPQQIGNLYAGQQLVMFGRFSDKGKLGISVSAKVSGKTRSWHTTAILPSADTDNPELERLWALANIEETMQIIRNKGENKDLRKKIVSLGLEYSLVTDYTSMLVITDDVMESEGITKTNANRVARERQAQQQKATQPTRNYQVDNNGSGFKGKASPGLGSGPVGPLGIAFLAWLNRRRNRLK